MEKRDKIKAAFVTKAKKEYKEVYMYLILKWTVFNIYIIYTHIHTSKLTYIFTFTITFTYCQVNKYIM